MLVNRALPGMHWLRAGLHPGAGFDRRGRDRFSLALRRERVDHRLACGIAG